MDSSGGGGDRAADDGVKQLRDMARVLEEMDSSLRSWDFPPLPPTPSEIKLRAMILRHVKMCILLFQYEDMHSVQQELCQWGKMQESGVSEFEARSFRSKIGCDGDDDDGGDVPSAQDLEAELFKIWGQFTVFLKLLKNCRQMDAARPTKGPKTKGGKGKAGGNEQILFNIFCGLEEMRRSRSYAAPSGEEIRYYREIRKWSLSSVAYVKARCNWQNDRKRGGSDRWITIDHDLTYELYANWTEFRTSVALDELPEFILLVKERVQRFSKASSNLREQEEVPADVVKSVGNVGIKSGDESQYRREVEKKRKLEVAPTMTDDDVKVLAGNGEVGKKSRVEYLRDILTAYEVMEPLGPWTVSTIRHARIHAMVEEHVQTSLWMYNQRNVFPWSQLKQLEGGRRIVRNKTNDGRGITGSGKKKSYLVDEDKTDDKSHGVQETKSREQFHEEILLLAEALKDSYMWIPTYHEMDYYRKILHQLKLNINMPFDYENGIAADGSLSDEYIIMLKHSMRKIYKRVQEFIKVMGEECLKLLQIVFPWIPKELEISDALKWLFDDNDDNRRRAVNELEALVESPQGLECIEHYILILEDITVLVGEVFSILIHVIPDMYFFRHTRMDYIHASLETSAAIRFLGPSLTEPAFQLSSR